METKFNCYGCPQKSQSIFQSTHSEALISCLQSKQLLKFNPGEYLISKGENSLGIFCIKSGSVKLVKDNSQGENGLILWIAKAADIIGLDTLINNESHSYSAIAISPVKACFIPEKEFKNLLKKNHLLTINVMKALSQKINLIEDRIHNISSKTVESRLISCLLGLSVKEGAYIEHSIEDLSGLIGTTKYYMEKIIGKMKKKNLIAVHKRRIMLLDVNKLKALGKNETSILLKKKAMIYEKKT
ncbi:MAG: Crp/Fnr family transcriptional regulator [Bacteroidetes bacterium]|nr:Crp/Fnr family transcriptional regulator [Bacteroidota bacterium]